MRTNIILIIFLLIQSVYAQNVKLKLKAVPAARYKYQYNGNCVSISGNYAITGAYGESRDASEANFLSGAGAAFIYEKDNMGNWSFKQKLVPADRAEDDAFGWDVAISGNYAIISAFMEDENESGSSTLSDAGSVYIFERNGSGVWVEKQKLVASDRAVTDYFGTSVAISGSYAIVGAEDEDHNASGGAALNSAGSAYIYERNGSGVWVQVKKIVALDRGADDNFGNDVSLNGNVAVVGAYSEDHDAAGANPKSNAGSAYIFERDGGGNWNQVKKIVASDRETDDLFASSVSVSGNFIIVGARVEDHDAAGGTPLTNSGSAYIFEKQAGVWNQVQKITASDRENFGLFGKVSVSGNFALVGAYGESQDANNGNPLNTAGAAYLFERNPGSGMWTQVQKFTAQHRKVNNYFGFNTAISGKNIIIGSPNDYLNASGMDSLIESGAAYIFTNCSVNVSAISPTACRKYISPKGKIYTGDAVFNDTFTNAEGCDSIISITLTVLHLDTSVTQNSATLSANEAGAQYKWIDCNDGNKVIPGAVSKSQLFLKNGSYAVIIEKSGCIDTSSCYLVNSASLFPDFLNHSFTLYPNPGTGNYEIISTEGKEISTLKVYDASGRLIMDKNPNDAASINLDMTGRAKGVYIIEITGNGFTNRLKLVLD